MSALVCVCGCPQGRHLLARRDCKSCPDCTQFKAAESVALDVGALLGEVQGDADREAELAARVAELQRELAEALEAERRCKANWHNAARERDVARAELASRPSEADWLALRSERARLRKAVAMPGPAVANAMGALLFAYDAWQCLGGSVNCSRRYYADDPDHACGPLTPVTVTVSRRSP